MVDLSASKWVMGWFIRFKMGDFPWFSLWKRLPRGSPKLWIPRRGLCHGGGAAGRLRVFGALDLGAVDPREGLVAQGRPCHGAGDGMRGIMGWWDHGMMIFFGCQVRFPKISLKWWNNRWYHRISSVKTWDWTFTIGRHGSWAVKRTPTETLLVRSTAPKA